MTSSVHSKKHVHFCALLVMFFVLLISGVNAFATSSESEPHNADEHHAHNNHSDVLLLLIADKLAVKKLQSHIPQLSSAKTRQANLQQQAQRLGRALQRLQQYVATPEGHYVNLELYQQSLENRASMLADFAQLLNVYHQQHDLDQTAAQKNLTK